MPAVSGSFYPADKDELYEEIHRSFTHALGPGHFPERAHDKSSHEMKVKCLIVPHAGCIYSGPVAAHSYLKAFEFVSQAREKLTAIIIGPNHYGIGSGVSLSRNRAWQTPLGEVEVDEDVTRRISDNSEMIDIDNLSHSREHSIEVQLPFLQVISRIAKRQLSIVPLCLMLQDRETSKGISKAVSSVIAKSEKDFLIIGSSDLTHYESQKQAQSKDLKLLDAISRLELSEFYTVLERLNVTACGYGAIASLISISKELGLSKGTILKYATSGDTSGDYTRVVGYSSVEFS